MEKSRETSPCAPARLAPLWTWLVLLLAAGLAACGGGGGDGGSSTPAVVSLKSIAVTSPLPTTLVVNSTVQLVATGTYSDGSTKVMTGLTWATKSGLSTVVQPATTGLVTARGTGTDTVTATSTADSVSGSIDLSVNAPWMQIAAGGYHTVGLKADGKLYSWGSNIRGQLGDGTSDKHNAPVTVAGGSTLWKQVVAGDRFTVAIRSDGTLWSWGYNLNGQLGDGTQNDKLVPTQVGSAKDWYMVAVGKAHVVALRVAATSGVSSYSLWTWGSNYLGQLGDGTKIDRYVPTRIGSGNWLTVAAGDGFSLGIQRSQQTLWTWGDNSVGQGGNGSAGGEVLVPTQVGLGTWSSVAAGAAHALAINSDNTLYSWGAGASGQLGNNSTSVQTTPFQLDAAKKWAQVAGGAEHSIGVRNDGTLWSWGSNSDGQLGAGGTVILAPSQVGNLSTWKAVGAGAYHSAAMRADSTLWTWGRNDDGQLGNGTYVPSSTPVNVAY